MDSLLIKKTLKSINKTLKLNHHKVNDLGIYIGLSGVSLFQFYYSKYQGNDDSENDDSQILKECVNKINKGNILPSFSNGIAGFGWVIDHLEQNNFIEVESDTLLPQFDNYFKNLMMSNLKDKNYDLLHGSLGYAIYFLKRYENTKLKFLKKKYKMILIDYIELLKSLSESENTNEVTWSYSSVNDTVNYDYNLGLAHGIPSIIAFLSKLHSYEDFKNLVTGVLKKAVNFLIRFKSKNKNDFSLFPNWIIQNEKIKYQSRLAWCYGDLSIGIVLLNASDELNDIKLRKIALDILEHSVNRKTPQSTLINDISICHGVFGIAKIFYRVYMKTEIKIYESTAEYWCTLGLKILNSCNKDIQKFWENANLKPSNSLSFLEGISGIGLVLLDFLSTDDLNWDECLMIN